MLKSIHFNLSFGYIKEIFTIWIWSNLIIKAFNDDDDEDIDDDDDDVYKEDYNDDYSYNSFNFQVRFFRFSIRLYLKDI